MIVMDSGLGGISVVRALRALSPQPLVYLADTAGFPYGKRSADDITTRARAIVATLIARHPGTSVVLACNTLSTLCLSALRHEFPNTAFVGTVPAIKTASALSKTRRFTLLATPNTADSSYSADLIAQFAADCVVDRYGAPNLAAMAESILLGEAITDDALRAELSPAFHDDAHGKTDCIVLGCTHYPLIEDRLKRVAPWPVTFIDSSEAIARRALSFASTPATTSIAYVTSKADIPRYESLFQREGFTQGTQHLLCPT